MFVFINSIQSSHDLGRLRWVIGQVSATVGDAVAVGETITNSGPHHAELYPLSPLSLAQLRCRQDFGHAMKPEALTRLPRGVLG